MTQQQMFASAEKFFVRTQEVIHQGAVFYYLHLCWDIQTLRWHRFGETQ